MKESAFSKLIREQLIKGDVNTEVPSLARMVKIVLASMHEGMPNIPQFVFFISSREGWSY